MVQDSFGALTDNKGFLGVILAAYLAAQFSEVRLLTREDVIW
jgi:hypothetical protein